MFCHIDLILQILTKTYVRRWFIESRESLKTSIKRGGRWRKIRGGVERWGGTHSKSRRLVHLFTVYGRFCYFSGFFFIFISYFSSSEFMKGHPIGTTSDIRWDSNGLRIPLSMFVTGYRTVSDDFCYTWRRYGTYLYCFDKNMLSNGS